MRLKSETRMQTEKNIRDAFWILYRERGMSNLTVKDVIRRAGYNRSTFYEYFLDLEDVLTKIEESLIPSIQTMPPAGSFAREVGMPLDEYVEFFKRHQTYYVVLLGEHGDPRFASKIKQSMKRTLIEHLPEIRTASSIEADFILEYVLSGMIGTLVHWLSDPQRVSEHQIIALMRTMMPAFVESNPLFLQGSLRK